MRTLRLFPLVVALVAFALPFCATRMSAADDDDEIGEHFESVPVPEGMTKEEIRDAIASVFAARTWIVKQKTDRRVVGYLKHRGNEATATLMFDGDQVEIYCVGWALNRRGERAKPEQPRGWLGNLKKDLVRRFAEVSATR